MWRWLIIMALMIGCNAGDNMDLSPTETEEKLFETPDTSKTTPLSCLGYTDYERSEYKHWIDEDGDGEHTREEVLKEEQLSDGRWYDEYTGEYYSSSSDLDIDHFIPLAEAHRSGGWRWESYMKQNFANYLSDPDHLVAVSSSVNSSKSDKDPFRWLPSINQADYATKWAKIKVKWGLFADASEIFKLKQLGVTDLPNQLVECQTTDVGKTTLDDGSSIYSGMYECMNMDNITGISNVGCANMNSKNHAIYHRNVCGAVNLDADFDGKPCEAEFY